VIPDPVKGKHILALGLVMLALTALPFLGGGVLVQAEGLFSFLWRSDPGEKFQEWLDEGRELRSRRLIDGAIDNFNRILEVDPVNDEATYEVALTYFEARRWLDAMDWLYIVSLFDPQRRDAYSKRWHAIFALAEGDSVLIKSARQAVKREIADFLEDYPWDWETLNTARQGAAVIGDSLLAEELTRRILLLYPDTPAGYEILSDRFYEGLYPIWRDDSAKVAYIRQFLADYRTSQFRETVWLYLTHSLSRIGDLNALRSALNEWMADDPENPLPYERAVNHLLDHGVSPDSLLPLARKAVDNCRGWRGKPLKHVERRVMEGKKLYADTRLNMARLLNQMGRNAEARLWLQDGLKNSGFGVDDEGTGAAFHFYLGRIAEIGTYFLRIPPPVVFPQEETGAPSGSKYAMLGNAQEAFDHYIDALIEGDARGKWTQKADSAVQKLFEERFVDAEDDLISHARIRKGYAGPRFEDATDMLGLSGVNASRVAWGDANGDGYDDLLLGGRRLFLNRVGTEFEEVTDLCGLHGDGIRGGVWADVDLDGDLDLFCAGNGGDDGGDRLFLNDENNHDGLPEFRDVTAQIGEIGDGFPTEGAAWGDLQGDGPSRIAPRIPLPEVRA
jgi:tetratricopeptide (TPR) repeat protein